MTAPVAHVCTWIIAVLMIGGVIVRPWNLPEAVWAVAGALLLVILALISLPDAGAAVVKGMDVYFFLTGMMLLAELARHEGLFDWLACLAVRRANGSAAVLFTLVYGVGTLVTIFLSNDATAVVLTPAVYAAARRAHANPLPYLYICAFIANAASFVLPISNPANLVMFGAQLPSLWSWLLQFGVASIISIAVTFTVLRFTQRRQLTGDITRDIDLPALSTGARVAAGGILATAVLLLVASSLDWRLGLPTLLAGLTASLVIVLIARTSPWSIVSEISWSVLPLVAGLFVLVRAVEGTGLFEPLVRVLPIHAAAAPSITAVSLGGVVALLCNLVNNLPLGLVAGTVAQGAHLSPQIKGALLIGIDLGPNLSVTGSLATILWLVALRREAQQVSGWRFLALGALIMPTALLASLAGFILLSMH